MIVPLQKDEALSEDIRSTPVSEDRCDVWWLGQSGFLVQWNGHRMVFDPYLSDSLTKKYAQTDKPHVRMTELVVEPSDLTSIEAVTSSHVHTDHLDAETLHPLLESNPGMKLILPEANVAFARERLGDGKTPELVPLNESASAMVGPFAFHGIAAAHNTVERDEAGRCKFLGFVVTFGPFAIFHSGDTLWHEGLVRSLIAFDLDLALLPINGNKPERRVAGNLNGTEAAALAKAVGAGLVVPCHYHQFEFNTEEPDEFVAACERLGQPHRVLQGGERLTLSK